MQYLSVTCQTIRTLKVSVAAKSRSDASMHQVTVMCTCNSLRCSSDGHGCYSPSAIAPAPRKCHGIDLACVGSGLLPGDNGPLMDSSLSVTRPPGQGWLSMHTRSHPHSLQDRCPGDACQTCAAWLLLQIGPSHLHRSPGAPSALLAGPQTA